MEFSDCLTVFAKSLPEPTRGRREWEKKIIAYPALGVDLGGLPDEGVDAVEAAIDVVDGDLADDVEAMELTELAQQVVVQGYLLRQRLLQVGTRARGAPGRAQLWSKGRGSREKNYHCRLEARA